MYIARQAASLTEPDLWNLPSDVSTSGGPLHVLLAWPQGDHTCRCEVQIIELEASLRTHEHSPAEEGEFQWPPGSSSAAPPPPPPPPIAEAECPMHLDGPQGQPREQQGVPGGAAPPPPPPLSTTFGGSNAAAPIQKVNDTCCSLSLQSTTASRGRSADKHTTSQMWQAWQCNHHDPSLLSCRSIISDGLPASLPPHLVRPSAPPEVSGRLGELHWCVPRTSMAPQHYALGSFF